MNWVATMMITIVGMSMGVGVIAIIAEHFQKMARIRAETQTRASDETMAAIRQLRAEVSELRDTSTQFDVSFDTALQRLEARVVHLEQARTGVGASDSRLHVEG